MTGIDNEQVLAEIRRMNEETAQLTRESHQIILEAQLIREEQKKLIRETQESRDANKITFKRYGVIAALTAFIAGIIIGKFL